MDLRLRAVTGAALAAVGVLFVLPAPAPAPAGPAEAMTVTGPPADLATAWPAAQVSSMPSSQADGSTFIPLLVLEPGTVAGMLNGKTFALRTPSGTRELMPDLNGNSHSLGGYTAAGGQIFWFVSVAGPGGTQQQTLWTADVAAGPARVLTSDTGVAIGRVGTLDLQIAGGFAHWAAEVRGGDTELRSIPVTGGTVTTTRVMGRYTVAAWPWLAPVVSSTGSPVELLNGETKAVLRVPGVKGRRLNCGPQWCRSSDDGILELRRADGSDMRRFGDQRSRTGAQPIGAVSNVEVFAGGAHSTVMGQARPLFVYDIPGRRVVRIDAAAGAYGVRDDWLMWSTGDGEAIVWHMLDLRTLKP
ncbi:hypothetical protein [Longispora albida]|uniref:hypothetical protein n=1 Tax=Longispora albida TaxID=203523 RepID=UPI0003A95A81|nr:hypothetical protein [Longispora albida]